MLVDFLEMPLQTRVWIYQSNKWFNDDEVSQIEQKLTQFLENWNNHGEGLKGSFTIKYNQFIILAVDEGHKEASGCSIDSSVRVIKDIEQTFNADLMNKLLVSFKIDDNINVVSLQDFKMYASQHKITKDTIVFNNLVNTIADFNSNWEIKASESWHARFL